MEGPQQRWPSASIAVKCCQVLSSAVKVGQRATAKVAFRDEHRWQAQLDARNVLLARWAQLDAFQRAVALLAR